MQIHTYVTESGGPELCAAYCNCIVFYLPSVARSHFIAAEFLLNGPHRIIQPSEHVTENLVSAFYILWLHQFLAAFGGQISFDGERFSMELIPRSILRFVNMSRETYFHRVFIRFCWPDLI
jgi:hypothetical protein